MHTESVPSIFVKDPAKAEMLQKAIMSPEIDQGLIPFLKLFFDLPITPRESCYGHVDEDKEPYLSFIFDDAGHKNQVRIQASYS